MDEERQKLITQIRELIGEYNNHKNFGRQQKAIEFKEQIEKLQERLKDLHV